MGLEEKRLLKHIKDNVFPRYEIELHDIVGFPLTYEVDWDSFANNRDAMGYMEDRIFVPVNDGFRDLCRDDLGKEAVKDGIGAIRLKQQSGESDHLILVKGVAELYCDWGYGTYYDAGMISERLGQAL